MVMSVASSLGLGVGRSVCSLLSLLFCCRCGGAFFFCCRCGGALFLLSYPGAPFVFLLSSRGPRFVLLSLRGAFFLCCCRPRERALFFAVVAGARFFLAVVAGARFFLLSLREPRGSLTHWLPGSAQRQQKPIYNNCSKKHGFRLGVHAKHACLQKHKPLQRL